MTDRELSRRRDARGHRRSVKEKLRGLYAHLKSGLERFKDKSTVDHNINERRSIVHEVNIKNVGTAEEVLRGELQRRRLCTFRLHEQQRTGQDRRAVRFHP
jgi:hypothetical protein